MAVQTRLANGLNVVSFTKQADEFGAVFVIPTPSLDSSGIAHLTEHMVFRYSNRFPARHSLFTMLSVLPVTLNASSHNGYSYFYVVSKSKSVLLKVISFLFAGIQQREYCADDIRRERDGVIARELAMYESNAEYQRQMSIWRGDRAPECYHHWGGYCDTLSQISVEDVAAFKGQYYQPNKIHLLVTGVDADELPLLCASKFDDETTRYTAKTFRFSHDTILDEYVFSWWLPECYIAGLLSAKAQLQDVVTPFDMQVYIEDTPNHQQKFALRLIGRAGNMIDAQEALIDKIRRLRITPKQHVFFESKYPETINMLLAWFHGKRPINRKVLALSQALALTPTITSFKPLRKPSVGMMQPLEKVPTECIGITDALDQGAPEFPTTLPASIAPLADNVSESTPFYYNQQHWVYHISLAGIPAYQQSDLLLNILSDGRLWLPRISGQCYAMGAMRVENGLRLYGAIDDTPQIRFKEINQIVSEHISRV